VSTGFPDRWEFPEPGNLEKLKVLLLEEKSCPPGTLLQKTCPARRIFSAIHQSSPPLPCGELNQKKINDLKPFFYRWESGYRFSMAGMKGIRKFQSPTRD
jgi:hypothetical protein